MVNEATTSVPLAEIEDKTASALVRHGATPEVAGHVAHAVQIAEANGNKICGLYYLQSYCSQLNSGRVLGDVEPVVTHDRPGAVRVDARFGFAQAAFAAGFDTATEAARANGVCGYAIEHSHTCTSLGYFTEQLAHAGLVAIGTTNSTARVAPPGGNAAVLGTNPFALAVPDGSGGVAFQFDFSTSAVALGKITMAAAAGEAIPVGWAVDEHGNDTTDPQAALRGSLVSAGGYKGFGMGLLVEVLASALTGSVSSADMAPLKAPEGGPHNIGQFYLLIDPQAYSGPAFHQAVTQLGALVAEQDGARLPGSRRAPVESVDIEVELWQATCELAAQDGT